MRDWTAGLDTQPAPEPDLKTIEIDGRTLYVIEDRAEAEALVRVARDRLFMEEAQRRFKKWLFIGGTVITGLTLLASWWPWISHMISALLRGAPGA